MVPSANRIELVIVSLASTFGIALPDPFWWALSGGFFGAAAAVLADEKSPTWRKVRRFLASLSFAVGLTELLVWLITDNPTRQLSGGVAAILAIFCWPVLLAFEKYGLKGFAQIIPELVEYYRLLKGVRRVD